MVHPARARLQVELSLAMVQTRYRALGRIPFFRREGSAPQPHWQGALANTGATLVPLLQQARVEEDTREKKKKKDKGKRRREEVNAWVQRGERV